MKYLIELSICGIIWLGGFSTCYIIGKLHTDPPSESEIRFESMYGTRICTATLKPGEFITVKGVGRVVLNENKNGTINISIVSFKVKDDLRP